MPVGPIANIAGSSFQAGQKIPQDVHVVDASGIAVSFGGSGGTSETDGAPFNNDTTVGTPAMGAYQSTPDVLTDGDLGIIALDVNRNLKVNVAAGGTSGTQYTEGDTDATITGTAALAEGAGDALVPLLVDASQHLQIDIAASSATVAVSNAGLTALNGAVAGSEVQVDVVAALPAGTNNIGDVDVLSVVPGTAATNLGKAEDAAHTTGDVGVMALAVRSDGGGTIAGADGDYTPLQVDSNGALRVTGGGGGTEYTEGDTDATFTGGVVLMEGAANTAVPLQGTAADGLLVNLGANNDVVATNAGTFAVQESGTALTRLNTLAGAVYAEDVAAQAADPGVAVLAVRRDADTSLVGTDNDYAQLQVDANGRLKVEAFSGETLPVSLASVPSHAVTNAGTFATQVDGAALTALQLIDNLVLAEDAVATTGDPGVQLLAVRASSPANTSGTNGDYEPLQVNAGRLWASATIDAALPAGTNNIGDVDVLSIVPGTSATSLGKAEDAAHTTGDTGVMILGVRAAAPTERSAGPTDGDYVPVGVNEVGAQWVSVTESANGGASTMNASSSDGATALTSTAQAIKASAGKLVGYFIYNPNATAQFVQFYNTAQGSVTVGTTTPLFMVTIPATSGANLWMPGGVAFGTAMSWAATSTAGGNGAPTTALDAVAWYK